MDENFKNELKEYLKKNLSISIQAGGDGYTEDSGNNYVSVSVTAQILLDGEVISTDSV